MPLGAGGAGGATGARTVTWCGELMVVLPAASVTRSATWYGPGATPAEFHVNWSEVLPGHA